MAILSNINGKFAVEDNGAIKFNNLTGTNNQVLIANTNSSPTWVDVSTIIGGPYLPLTGGTLAGAGNLVVGGTLTVNGVTTLNAALTGTTATFTKDQNADTTLKLYNPNTGTSAGANMYITNTSANADGLFLGAIGVNAGSGGFIADSGIVGSGTGASGGLVLMAREASSGIRFYTGGYTDLALSINSSQNATFTGNVFARRGSFGTGSNFNFDLYCNGNAYINDELTVDDNATFAGNVRVNGWIKGASDTNTLYSSTSLGTYLQSPTNSGTGGNIYFRNSSGTVFQTFSQSDGSATFVGTLAAGATTITSATNPLLLTLNSTASGYGGILFQYGGATKGLSYYNSNMMIFGGEAGIETRIQSGGQYAITALTNGNVGIGTASPGTYKLNVAGTGLFTGGLEMAGGGAVYQGQKFWLDGGGDTFLESPSSNLMTFTTGGTERMRIESDGTIRAKTGSIVVDTAGQGIYLGGTAVANNLNYYASGTWTPTVTTSQLTSPTITSSSGRWQRVGKVVTASFEFTMSNPTVGAGTVIISNLPIAIADTDHVSGCGVIGDLGKTINVRHYTATNQIGMNFYDGNYCGTAFRTVGTVTYWAAT